MSLYRDEACPWCGSDTRQGPGDRHARRCPGCERTFPAQAHRIAQANKRIHTALTRKREREQDALCLAHPSPHFRFTVQEDAWAKNARTRLDKLDKLTGYSGAVVVPTMDTVYDV
jgi:tRNA/tmRNA/rRNA uracil-C5-methylase (TrmA/RlmC/RlmD family)